MQIREFLKTNGVPFIIISKCEVFDLLSTLARVDGCLIKTVLLIADHGYRYVVAALPVDREFNRELASHLLGGALLANPQPEEMTTCRPEGTDSPVSPFGSMCGRLTIVDQSVGQRSQILFEDKPGELLCFSWRDFVRIEHPLIGEIAVPSQATTSALSRRL